MVEYFKGAKGSWMWLAIRLYIGYQWLLAGWGKLTGANPFDATGYLKGAAAKYFLSAEAIATGSKPFSAMWWGDFLNSFAIPGAKIFNVMVPIGELMVGLALIIGFATIFSACMAALMNFAFLMSGSTSSSPYLFALSFILVVAGGAHAGFLGVDYFFRPHGSANSSSFPKAYR
ncbi:MAG TPA: DoxX family membrane protein [Symbiobacteriaceae bacterium]|nr:DoxX family membrane protein [Symbiobacteriaceae bacterium]